LYFLDVGEQDFHQLKREQSIRVDFSVFPSEIIELVESCSASVSRQTMSESTAELLATAAALTSSSSQPHIQANEPYSSPLATMLNMSTSQSPAHYTPQSHFVAKLDAQSGNFAIFEVNHFKQLLHISLRLRPANDSAIKSYLAARLQMFTTLSRRLTRELESQGHALHTEVNKGKQLVDDINEMRLFLLS
jgi:hypothetical protein